MTTAMKAEIIVRETIKPSSPTPDHLRCFKLSFVDQLAPLVHTSLVLYYSNDGNSTERSQRLKKSLSETLTHFYPLAGRIKDSVFIDCNDSGVDYLEVRVNCPLSDILEKHDPEVLFQFLPGVDFTEAGTGPLLLVQASFFECGGMAIGVRISHKLTDAATFSTFIKCWVAIAAESSERVFPEFNMASLFPPRESIMMPTVKLTKSKCSTRRFVFHASKITALKAKAASESVPQPTRVEVVSALIWKCAMKASRSNSKSIKLSVLSQSVNMRKRIVPPLPDNSFGNFIASFITKTGESEIELQGLVSELRKGIGKFSESYVRRVQEGEGFLASCENFKEYGNLVRREDVDFYGFTSWCRFSLYEADFGWGKPTWVSLASSPFKNFVVLMDTRDGDGIEVWVFLSEEEMTLFECDQELLTYASLNPSILD